MKLSVVIPFYNEEAQVPVTLEAVAAVLAELPYDYELILVDDGSRDSTWAALERASSYTRAQGSSCLSGTVRAIGFSRNFGKEAAICAGLHVADGDAAIVMDGDMQHPPEYIPKMVSIWNEGEVDVVEGVKSHRGKESLSQKLNALIFYRLFSKSTGFDLRNASDFKLLDKKVLEQWRRLGEHDTFFRALSAWLGFSRRSFEFVVPERKLGSSKWSLPKLVGLSINAITSFTALPLQIITLFGVLFLLFSVGLGVQTLVNWFSGTAADGFTTVILLILFSGGAMMISLGLIGIYIGRIFTEVKSRPRYIVSREIRR
ncbi:MAG: glycosyltransferase family 2 protein [Saccharofermentanales bacterium]